MDTTDNNGKTNDSKSKAAELRDRFTEKLGKGLDDTELLSLVISFTNKGEDCEEIAKRLMSKYKALHNILCLDTETLKQEGLSDHTAMMLESVYSTMSYRYDKSLRKEKFDTVEKLGKFFIHKYIGVSYEKLYLALFDLKLRMIDCIAFDNGSVNQTYVPQGKIARLAIEKRACYMVIAHNHPNGVPIPSDTDIKTTHSYAEMGKSIGVYMLEHILVAGGRFTPVMLYMNERQVDMTLTSYSTETLMAVDKLKKRGIKP